MARYVIGALAVLALGCSGVSNLVEESSGTTPNVAGATAPVAERTIAFPTVLPGNVTGPQPPRFVLGSSQCNAMQDGGPVNGPDCVTAEITCDSTTIGHTVGGVHRFDTRWYGRNFCWPATEAWSGGDERVYRLRLPGPEVAVVTLETPCAGLDMFAAKWNDSGCPSNGSQISHCESGRKPGTTSETMYLNTYGDWLIIVEGSGDEEGAFALHVQCGEWF